MATRPRTADGEDQLDRVAAGRLANLAAHTPLLRDADRLVLVDVDDTVRRTYGYARQGAGYSCSGVEGLNALLEILSTPTSTLTVAPVIAATRLRKGNVSSAGGPAGRRHPRRRAPLRRGLGTGLDPAQRPRQQPTPSTP